MRKNDDELLAVALPLRPLRAGPAPPGLGTAGHGLIFGLLKRQATAVGNALHALPELRLESRQPFTASPLLDRPDGTPVSVVRPDRCYWLRLTFLAQPMVQLWHERLLPALPSVLHLGPVATQHHETAACAWDFVCAPDATPLHYRRATYAQLAALEAVERWRLRFITPTTFQPALAPADRATSPRGLCLPLPVPELILRNLASSWTRWAPPDLHPLATEPKVLALSRHIQIEASHLTTGPVSMRTAVRPAFTGDVILRYHHAQAEPEAHTAQRLRLLCALLGLASFAGVGVQTARGMGVVEVEPIDEG